MSGPPESGARPSGPPGVGQQPFGDELPSRQRLIVVGAVPLAAALCRLARGLGWAVQVLDPRDGFAERTRFPEAEEVLSATPGDGFARLGPLDAQTAVVIVAHEPAVDDPALELALRSAASYVGAMGSRRTQAARRERLLERGLAPAELERLAAPIGLDLGAVGVEETALAVVAEIVAVGHGRAGGRLKDAAGRIREAEA